MSDRPLICPICGARILSPVEGTGFPGYPEVHRLGIHPSANGMNLCQGLVITVTIDLDQCSKCSARMSKHPSGLCQKCFREEETLGRTLGSWRNS